MIYITPPPNKTHKNHPPPPSPRIMSSSPLAVLLPHVAPALFLCLSVHLFVWLVVALSLCPLSLLPILLRRHTTSLRCVASLVVPLVLSSLHHCVAALSRRRIITTSRRRVVPSLRCRIDASSRCRVVASSRCRVVASSHRRVVESSSCCIIASLRHRVITLSRLVSPRCCIATSDTSRHTYFV